MTVYVETQRIYVASLSDYNAGRLHGVHINLNECDTIDDVWAQINKMLADSPEAKAFPQGGKAEEWAIHDYEGFGTWHISEYASINRVFVAAKFIEQAHNKEAAAIFLAHKGDEYLGGDSTPESLDDAFGDHFAGEWDSERDFAENLVNELGLPDVGNPMVNTGPDWNPQPRPLVELIESYLNWDRLATDMAEGYTLVSEGGSVFAFHDEA
jgi:antirestriction protein